MGQTLADHGDLLERRHAGFLAARLPQYEILWAAFVGNDGSSQLPEVSGLPEEWQKVRAAVNQYAYTAAESAIVADHAAARLGQLAEKVAGARALSADDYLSLSATVFAFYGHLGRARDMMLKLGTSIRNPALAAPLNEYYQQRNNILHEARVPLILLDGIIAIVPPEGEKPDSLSWRRDSLWSDAERFVVRDLNPLINKTLEGFLSCLNGALAKAHSHLMLTPLRAVPRQLAASAPSIVGLVTPSATHHIPIWPSGSLDS